MADRVNLALPDDWHLHLRDGAHMRAVLPQTAVRFGRAIVMPNLRPPVTTTDRALAYRERIIAALPEDSDFEPLMTLYLTDNTKPIEIVRARESGVVHAVKYYPAGATTNSDSGVTDLARCYAALEKMAELGMPLCVHGEVTDPTTDIFDRERIFLDTVLVKLAERLPTLKIVVEHITTLEAAQFVRDAGPNIGATVTAHHLLLNRNALFVGGVRPHHYCLPVIKREKHRCGIVMVIKEGCVRIFLGTDSAPHARHTKETSCGCAGVYTAHAGIELYAEAFDNEGMLDRLEGFASHYGPDFYNLPRNTRQIVLVKTPHDVPEAYTFGDDELVPLRAGESVAWRVEGLEYPELKRAA